MQAEPEPGGYRAGIETGPDGEPTGDIICYPSFSPNCKVVRLPKPGALDSTGFLSPPDPSPFHDKVLVKATAEINAVLAKVLAERDPAKGDLHVILAEDGPMLAWVRTTVLPFDDTHGLRGAHSH